MSMADSYSEASTEEDLQVCGDDCGEYWSRLKQPVKRFSPAQTASLKASYANGMVGTGKQYQVLIEKTASGTALSISQVKVLTMVAIYHALRNFKLVYTKLG